MSPLFWFGFTVLCAAAASYLSGFVGEAIRGWREGRDIVPMAQRAFKGELSIDAKLLAQRVLFPEGYVHLNRTMLPALREFARALVELKRSGRA